MLIIGKKYLLLFRSISWYNICMLRKEKGWLIRNLLGDKLMDELSNSVKLNKKEDINMATKKKPLTEEELEAQAIQEELSKQTTPIAEDIKKITEQSYVQKSVAPQIVQSIGKIMTDMESIPKTKEAKGLNYAFRGIDAVMKHLNPLLVKHGVFIIPKMEARKCEVLQPPNKIIYVTEVSMIYEWRSVIDNSSITVPMKGESVSYDDKGTAKAMSNAFKIMVFQMLCIPTEDMPEGEDEDIRFDGEEGRKTGATNKSAKKENRVLTTKERQVLYQQIQEIFQRDFQLAKLIEWIALAMKEIGLKFTATEKLTVDDAIALKRRARERKAIYDKEQANKAGK